MWEQAYDEYLLYQSQIKQCDTKIEKTLVEISTKKANGVIIKCKKITFKKIE